MKRWRYVLPAAVLTTCSHGAMAQSNAIVSMDLSAGASVETNPFLQSDSGAALSGRIQVDPSIRFEDEISSTRLEGSLRVSQYSTRYGADEAVSIAGETQRRLNERSRVHAEFSLRSSRNAVQDSLRGTEGDLLDLTGPGADIELDLPPVDTTIAGTRSRVTSVAGTVGMETSVSLLATLGGSFSYNQSWFDDDLGFKFRRVSGRIDYSRQLSERTGLTLATNISYVDYLGARQGDSMIVEPEVGIQRSLSARTTFSAGFGLSYVNSRNQGGGSRDDVFLAGNIRLCTRRELGAMCFSAQRSAQPTALGGVSAVTSMAVNYDERVSRTSSFSLGVRYGNTERRDERWLDATFQATEIVAASASYYRGLTNRLSAYSTASIAKVFDKVQERKLNASLTVGLSMRIGSLR